MAMRDLTGQRFGRISVIKFAFVKGKKAWWTCKCDCGSTKDIRSDNLTCGETLSCGCFSREKSAEIGHKNATHGRTRTPAHNVWKQMKQRCENTKNHAFERYGGRGITVCDRWKESFEVFLFDMGECPKGMTLERINNNGPYSPENCRWASRKDQNSNTRGNVFFEWEGKRMTLSQWAALKGISTSVVSARIHKLGWTIEKSLFTPLSTRGRRKDFPNSPGAGL